MQSLAIAVAVQWCTQTCFVHHGELWCIAFQAQQSSSNLESGTFKYPQPLVFSQKYRRYKWEVYCGTNGRRTALQIGSVLRRFPFSKAYKPARHSVTNGGRTAVQNWRCTEYFSDKLYGLGFLKSLAHRNRSNFCELRL